MGMNWGRERLRELVNYGRLRFGELHRLAQGQ
jgi:hypothetical protein